MKKAFTGAMRSKINFGFTLAEVLITLGVIGVVAAITIPTLIANYQKKVLENQFKSTISILSQGFKNWAENDDIIRYVFIDAPSIDVISTIQNYQTYGSYGSNDKQNKRLILKYFKGTLTYNAYDTSSPFYYSKKNQYTKFNQNTNDITSVDAMVVYTLNNGVDVIYASPMELHANVNKLTPYYYGIFPITIDINGMDKKPNKIGYDLFKFALFDDGTLVPEGSAQYALFMNKSAKTREEALTSTYYWQTASKTSNNGCRKENYTGTGFGCGARIMEENWKMNY